MSKSDPFRRPLRTFFSDAVAVTSVGAAVVATLGLGSAMKHTPTLFFCSVMLSSWFGGMWPGILAGVLSAIALDYYFVPPLYALGIGLKEGVRVIRS
jgi:K+-sensing histidine kinase KdpD